MRHLFGCRALRQNFHFRNYFFALFCIQFFRRKAWKGDERKEVLRSIVETLFRVRNLINHSHDALRISFIDLLYTYAHIEVNKPM
jgi:hypothetical protein